MNGKNIDDNIFFAACQPKCRSRMINKFFCIILIKIKLNYLPLLLISYNDKKYMTMRLAMKHMNFNL